MTSTTPQKYSLVLPIHIRGNNLVQLGLFTQSALALPLPDHVQATHVAQVLKDTVNPHTVDQCSQKLEYCGLNSHDARSITTELINVGALLPEIPTVKIAIVGTLKSAKVLYHKLSALGFTVRRLQERMASEIHTDEVAIWATNKHIASQDLLDLHKRRIPYVWCLLAPSQALLSHFVIPGHTACLQCLQHHLLLSDPEWKNMDLRSLGRRNYAGEDLVSGLLATQLSFNTRLYWPLLCNSTLRKGSSSHSISRFTMVNTTTGSSEKHLVPMLSECFCCRYGTSTPRHMPLTPYSLSKAS